MSKRPSSTPDEAALEATLVSGAEDARPADAPLMAEEEEALLEQARAHWQLGDWVALAALAERPLEHHPDRGRLALLAAVGFAQTGNMKGAAFFARRARDWGCPRDLLTRVLVGGVYNSLGRVASVLGEEPRASGHFETSVDIVSPRADARALGRARQIHEKARLGQLPEAAALLGAELEAAGAEVGSAAQTHLRERLTGLQSAMTRLGEPGLSKGFSEQGLPAILRAHRLQRNARPQGQLRICCHHKTGTNFLLPVFRTISRRFKMPIWLKFYDTEPENWDICLHQHARISDIPDRGDFRGVHMIRHPMGLIYSAMRYHSEACPEPWAHIPLQRFTRATFAAVSNRASYLEIADPDVPLARKQALMAGEDQSPPATDDFDSGYDFAGRTYADMINSFDTVSERLRFEMHAYSQGVIRDMIGFPADQRFLRLRLEDVSHDPSMGALQTMVSHLGFAGAPAAQVLEIAANNCLWHIPRPAHATTGVSDTWRGAFADPDLQAGYRRLFGWAEQALGYPPTHLASAPDAT